MPVDEFGLYFLYYVWKSKLNLRHLTRLFVPFDKTYSSRSISNKRLTSRSEELIDYIDGETKWMWYRVDNDTLLSSDEYLVVPDNVNGTYTCYVENVETGEKTLTARYTMQF